MNSQQMVCPVCEQTSKLVDNATVKAIISVSLRRVQDEKHYFCSTETCDVVYFNESRTETFSLSDVRQRVYQKEPTSQDVLICYCFQHTVGDVRSQRELDNDISIVDNINAGIKAGQCACDWRNPQGTCCLGNVLALRKIATNHSNSD